jgi:Amt family ammonium transporter
LDSIWVLLSAFLVFFMHAGFALVESGFCRRKNAVMVLLKNFAVLALGSLVFFAFGFGLMFGDGSMWLGLNGFFPAADARVGAAPGNLPLYVFLFFQLVFAATAATIVSGAVAERARLSSFLLFTVLAVGVIYPLVGHAVWGGGWLASWGFHDFAGSTVVHAVGGGMALAGALAVGPRRGKYRPDGSVRPMPAHNFPLAALGVLVLWLGWFGFNGGSTLAADPHAIAPVILVTNLAAASGFLAALLHVRLRTRMLDLSMALNGALAGLVAITAGCDVIAPRDAMIVGAVGGVLVVEGVLLLERLRVDDPVGAIPVHLGAGVFGTAAVGLLASSGDALGVAYGGSWRFLVLQCGGALAGAAVAFAASWLIWSAMARSPLGVRVDAAHEHEGLDLAECGVQAYGEELYGVGADSLDASSLSPAVVAPRPARGTSG